MIEAMFDAQAFQSSGGVNGHKTMIALCAHPPRGRLSQGSIGLERFMKRLHFPPFLIDRFDGFAITMKITASQKYLSCAFIFVCKDLPK